MLLGMSRCVHNAASRRSSSTIATPFFAATCDHTGSSSPGRRASSKGLPSRERASQMINRDRRANPSWQFPAHVQECHGWGLTGCLVGVCACDAGRPPFRSVTASHPLRHHESELGDTHSWFLQTQWRHTQELRLECDAARCCAVLPSVSRRRRSLRRRRGIPAPGRRSSANWSMRIVNGPTGCICPPDCAPGLPCRS